MKISEIVDRLYQYYYDLTEVVPEDNRFRPFLRGSLAAIFTAYTLMIPVIIIIIRFFWENCRHSY